MERKDSKRIIIFDTTLRDGEQSPGVNLNQEEKLQIGKHLVELGVDVIEAGFPATSQGDFSGVELLARELKGVQIAALARAIKDDINTAWQAIKDAENPRIHTFLATSDIHLKHKLRKTKTKAIKIAQEAVRYAAGLCPNVEFSAEDASRSDLDYVCRVFEAVIEAGATTVNFPDTTGYALPQEFHDMIAYVLKNTKNISKAVLSVHCHNDLGLATANTLAAIAAGATQAECTINGIGERAGNSALEEVVMAIKTRSNILCCETGITAKNITKTSRLVQHLTGMRIQPNKAIVGANAFLHEAGIHQDGVLKHRNTYEIIDPKDIGLVQDNLVLGKHSGRKAIENSLKNMGHTLSGEDLGKVFIKFKTLADKKGEIYPEDLEIMAIEEVFRVPDHYRLNYLHVASGMGIKPTATLTIEINEVLHDGTNIGVGPVDAAFGAIAKITGTKSKLIRFEISSITRGTDAQGEVTVRLEENGLKVTGFGADPDIITAAANAYLNALNRLWRLANAKKIKSKQKKYHT